MSSSFFEGICSYRSIFLYVIEIYFLSIDHPAICESLCIIGIRIIAAWGIEEESIWFFLCEWSWRIEIDHWIMRLHYEYATITIYISIGTSRSECDEILAYFCEFIAERSAYFWYEGFFASFDILYLPCVFYVWSIGKVWLRTHLYIFTYISRFLL